MNTERLRFLYEFYVAAETFILRPQRVLYPHFSVQRTREHSIGSLGVTGMNREWGGAKSSEGPEEKQSRARAWGCSGPL